MIHSSVSQQFVRFTLERLGMSDADTILQLAAAKSDAEFGPWFADLVRILD